MNEQLQKKIYVALNSYLGDIEYASSNGYEVLNSLSNGTPYFDADDQANSYVQAVRDLVQEVEACIDQPQKVCRTVLWEENEKEGQS